MFRLPEIEESRIEARLREFRNKMLPSANGKQKKLIEKLRRADEKSALRFYFLTVGLSVSPAM